MFYLILTVVTLGLALWMKPNETKAFMRWSGAGIKGVSNDIQAVHNASIKARVNNPKIVEDTQKLLDNNIIDTRAYHKSAAKRRLESQKVLAEALAELGEQ